MGLATVVKPDNELGIYRFGITIFLQNMAECSNHTSVLLHQQVTTIIL